MTAAAWWIVLWIAVASDDGKIEVHGRYYPTTLPDPYSCAMAGREVLDDWPEAKGFSCVMELPDGATPLPARIPAGRWA